MAEPERSGAEAGDRAAGVEWRVVYLGAVKCLEAIARGIAKRDQPLDAAIVGQRGWFGRDLDFRVFQPRRERIQRRRVGNLPAEEALALGQRAVDDDALLAVVHPESQQRGTALHPLQPDQPGAELPPIV